MTRSCWIAGGLTAVAIACAVPLYAAEGDEAPSPDKARNHDRPDAERPNVDRAQDRANAFTNGLRDGVALERLLEYVKKNNPEEFERLTRLRRENPAEFREILRNKFQEASEIRRKSQEAGRPHADTPRTDRDRPDAWKSDRPRTDVARDRPAAETDRSRESTDRMHNGARMTTSGSSHEFGRMHGGEVSPEYRETTELVRKMADEYRSAEQPKREAIEKRIHEKVEHLYDLRERERAAQLERMEKELARLRAELDGRKELRGKIIDRRVDEILGRDLTQW